MRWLLAHFLQMSQSYRNERAKSDNYSVATAVITTAKIVALDFTRGNLLSSKYCISARCETALYLNHREARRRAVFYTLSSHAPLSLAV